MTHKASVFGGVLMLAVGLGGCDSPATPLTPSAQPPPATVLPPGPGPLFPSGYTLKGVSLSGVVYELTPTGRSPIPGARVYCELCTEATHAMATADEDGFYLFTGDLAAGGGVWITPGFPTPIAVGLYNNEFKDPPGLPVMRQGPGWREVFIDGDTRFDIELVRR